MIANTGTYLDAPSHRWPDGPDLTGVPLDRLADLPGVRGPGAGRHPGGGPADAGPVRRGRAGGAAAHRLGRALRHRPVRRTRGAVPDRRRRARWLVEAGAALVGIDSINIDDMSPAAGRRAPRAQHPARRRRPDRGAPDRPGRAAADRVPLHRRAAEGGRHGHLPGPRLRRRRLTGPTARPAGSRASPTGSTPSRRPRPPWPANGPAPPSSATAASKHYATCGWPAAARSTSAPTPSARSRP